jgi:hypothetical protein
MKAIASSNPSTRRRSIVKRRGGPVNVACIDAVATVADGSLLPTVSAQ